MPSNIVSRAKSPPDIIAMLGDVTIEAAAGEAAKGPRKFDVVAYTGGKLVVAGYDLPVVVDLKGLTARKSIVANLDHDRKQRVGHVTGRHNDGLTLRLEGIASAATSARNEVVASADDGFSWQASIEAAPQKLVKVAAGKTVEVNGQSFEGPLLVARKAMLGGFAFLSHGADENTSVTIAASAADSSKETDMEFTKWIEAMDFDPADLTDKQKASLKAKYEGEIAASAKDGDAATVTLEAPVFDADEIKAAYSEHVANIEAALAEHEENVRDKKVLAEIKAGAFKAARELKTQAMKARWPAMRLEVEAIKAASAVELALVKAERPKGPAIHGSTRDMSGPVIEAAMCQAVGLPAYEKGYSEQVLEAAHKQFRGRIGLQQVLIMAAHANGLELPPGERLHNGNLRTVLHHALMPDIHAASTFSLPGVLSNVANKELLTGFMEEDQTWREIAVTKPVSNFYAVTSYRLLDNMEYEELGQDGKIAHGQLGQETMTRQAKTYAKMFALTRVDIINDDLGAFNDLRTRLGRGSSRKFNNLFWTKFLDNGSFFTTARGNYITGATTNLGTDGVGLEAGVLKFRQMKTADDKRLDGAPDRLLIPPELQFNGQRLHQSTQVNTGGSATATSVPSDNIHAGKYRPVVQNRLSDSTFTGYSATAWYLFRDPGILAPMVVSFLNGVETPTVESADADFDQLGVQFRGYHDFGVDFAEWLAGVKSKGAA